MATPKRRKSKKPHKVSDKRLAESRGLYYREVIDGGAALCFSPTIGGLWLKGVRSQSFKNKRPHRQSHLIRKTGHPRSGGLGWTGFDFV